MAVISVAVLVGAAAIFPSYLRALSSYSESQAMITLLRANKSDQNLDAIRTELTKDNSLLSRLSEEKISMRFSDIIRAIGSVRGDAVIDSFTLTKKDAENIAVSLNGSAPTRDELLAFKARLEATVSYGKIDIPIEQLAKSSNPSYRISFVKHLK